MALTKTESLTPTQLKVFEWIKIYIRKNQVPPSVRTIGEAFDRRESTIHETLKAIEEKGLLKRNPDGNRLLSLTDSDSNKISNCFIEIALVGRIAAGKPIEALEHEEEKLSVKKSLLKGRKGFALQVTGESMIKAGILDGDIVVVKKQNTADDGDIVVALIEEEATLKRFFRYRNGIKLVPENPAMSPIYVKSDRFRIQGKVVEVRRAL